jgi:adenylyltransferase and sulfurtransferase
MAHKSFIERYSRQMLVPGIGLAGQVSFQSSTVLIIGCGGLGCPVALYLAAAGVGKLRVCDGDTVEASNMPRQILHRESSLGMNKAQSIVKACAEINSSVQVDAIESLVTVENVLDLMDGVDVVVDATDNVVTRYLINDAAAIKNIPLVSGAALGWDGQVSVFTYNKASPCYRCLYPQPPPASAITNCDLAGVVGPVTGLIGSLQALQVLRILADLQPACTESLLTFSGTETSKLFRQLKLRGRNPECIACGDQGLDRIYDAETGKLKLDYIQFCGGQAQDDKNPDLNLLTAEDRITCKELKKLLETSDENTLLIDVRPANQFELCSITGSHLIPIDTLSSHKNLILELAQKYSNIVFICRRGNDSQLAVQQFKRLFPGKRVRDLIGGLRSWAKSIDEEMPIY